MRLRAPHRPWASARGQSASGLRGLQPRGSTACKTSPPERIGSTVPHLGLKRSAALEPPQAARCYERQQSGKSIHPDNKKRGRFDRISQPIIGERKGQSNSRGVGWELAHFCIDDAARVSFTN